MTSAIGSLLGFVAIIAMIPVALWLLKRTPIGGGAANGVMRTVAMPPISTNQRLLTVEVGTGDDKKWLVLGVTPAGITTLHTMVPQAIALQPQVWGAEVFHLGLWIALPLVGMLLTLPLMESPFTMALERMLSQFR